MLSYIHTYSPITVDTYMLHGCTVLISVYLSVVHPSVKNAPFHSGGGGDNGCTGLINHCGMYQRMYAVRVLNALFSGTYPRGVPPHHAKLVHIVYIVLIDTAPYIYI